MGRSLRILSINFPFKNSEVIQQPRLSTPYACFDYDVVVIRPHGIPRVDGPEWPVRKFQREMHGKRPELAKLISEGGLLIVILDSCVVREYHPSQWSYFSEGGSYRITNYDFLHDDFFNCVRNGVGDRLHYVDPANPFSAVLRSSKVQWSAYIDLRAHNPLGLVKIFARNAVTSAVGASLGSLVFLPNFLELDEGRFFDACREFQAEREGVPPPHWIGQILVPGEGDLVDELSKLTESIARLEWRSRQVSEALNGLQKHKKLLYEKGKHHLEPAVRAALDQFGFKTTPGEHIPGTDYEIDGRTTQGSVAGILEVKGSKRQIAFEELSPFILKVISDQEKSSKASKGILVGNGLCETPPESRLGEAVFAPHVLNAARDHSVALVNSVELFWLLCATLAGEVKDLEPIREHILSSSGYVDLRPFCSGFPFSPSKKP